MSQFEFAHTERSACGSPPIVDFIKRPAATVLTFDDRRLRPKALTSERYGPDAPREHGPLVAGRGRIGKPSQEKDGVSRVGDSGVLLEGVVFFGPPLR